MFIYKNKLLLIALAIALLVIYFGGIWKSNTVNDMPSESPASTVTASPSATSIKSPNVTKLPLPTGDGKTTFIGERVPWQFLLSDASCELKGEIKFLNKNTYDNQDATFTYKGVDNPGRNIRWTITPPEKNLAIGPNIFEQIPLPDGKTLLGIFPSGDLSYKKYELTVVMEYARLVDDNGKFVSVGGNVRVYEKQCTGKTTIVVP